MDCAASAAAHVDVVAPILTLLKHKQQVSPGREGAMFTFLREAKRVANAQSESRVEATTRLINPSPSIPCSAGREDSLYFACARCHTGFPST